MRSSAAPESVFELPFEYRSGLIWVRLNVAPSSEPLNFLVDSGAGVSVIDLRTAQRLGVRLARRVHVRGVGSSTEGFWPVRLHAKAGGLELPREWLAVDLTALSHACDRGVEGLLGADFFRRHVVQVDFAASKIRLLSSSSFDGDGNFIPLKSNRGAMLAAVHINDAKVQWFRVDTGCASPLQWVVNGHQTAAQPSGVSVGLTELNIPTTTTLVRLGSLAFDSVPTGLHQHPIFSGESGLLGNGLIACFERVTFDLNRGRLVLEGRRSSP